MLVANTGNQVNKSFFLISFIAAAFWFLPPPEMVTLQGWKVFVIFIASLAFVISHALDMGVVALFALAMTMSTGVLPVHACLAKFSHPTIWLVLMAFFISRGFSTSGLGARIALFLASRLGTTPVRLSYSLMLAELLMAPLIPSNTARGAGMIYPIARSLGENVFGEPQEGDKTPYHPTAFLLYSAFQTNLITSALFLTAMPGNQMLADMSATFNVPLNWVSWFKAAIIPCAISALLTPWILILLLRPNFGDVTLMREKSIKQYKELGPMKRNEILMGIVFIALLCGWFFGPNLGLNDTAAVLLAVTGLLITGVLNWKDISTDGAAWTTFIWLTVLLTLSVALKDLGVIDWLSAIFTVIVPQGGGIQSLIVLTCINFFSHYFFASLTSHVVTLYQPLMMIGLAQDMPLLPLSLLLAFSTSLSAGLTHYSTGSASVIYGAGYWSLKDWWILGLIHSTLLLAIFFLIGIPVWDIIFV